MGFFKNLISKRNYFGNVKTVGSRKEYYHSKRVDDLFASTGNFNFDNPELCSTVYTAISIIANTISKLPLNVYKQTSKGKELYKTHRWYNTLRYNPDLRLSTQKWLNYAITNLYCTGNAYFLASDFDQNFNLKSELKPLIDLQNIVQYDNEVYYKFKNVDGWIPSRRLVHFYLLSKDGITGINPISAIRNEISIQHGSEKTVENFYKNNLFSILYIEQNAEALAGGNNKKLNEYYEKLEKEFTGSMNSGKIITVPPLYSLKSLPLQDLKFLSNAKYTVDMIGAIFQLPGYMLGSTNNSSTGKVETEMLNFLNQCLDNVCAIIRNELEAKLLTIEERNNGVSIDFDYTKLYSLDLESKAIYLKTLSSIGAVSPNDVKEAFGFDRVDNEFMNYHFIQSQNQAIEKYGEWGNNNMNTNASTTTDSGTGDNDNTE